MSNDVERMADLIDTKKKYDGTEENSKADELFSVYDVNDDNEENENIERKIIISKRAMASSRYTIIGIFAIWLILFVTMLIIEIVDFVKME